MKIKQWINNNPKLARNITIYTVLAIIALIVLNPIKALMYFVVLGVIPYTPIAMNSYFSWLFCLIASYFLFKWGKKVKADYDVFMAQVALNYADEVDERPRRPAKVQRDTKLNIEDLRISHL